MTKDKQQLENNIMWWNKLISNVFLVCKLLKNLHLSPQLNFRHSLKKFRYLNENI